MVVVQAEQVASVVKSNMNSSRILVVCLLFPPVSVSLFLPHVPHSVLYLPLFVPQRVSERLGSELQLCRPHLLRHTVPAGRVES